MGTYRNLLNQISKKRPKKKEEDESSIKSCLNKQQKNDQEWEWADDLAQKCDVNWVKHTEVVRPNFK